VTRNKRSIDPSKSLVIMDNDRSGPTGFLPTIIGLASHNVEVLGLTTVTGNAWNTQQNRHCLRLLEIAGRTDIPVASGGLYPPSNTQDRFQLCQNLYGNPTWSGAYGKDYGYPYDPMGGDPYVIRDLPEGNPSPGLTVTNLTTAEFMIQKVKAYPGRVTIYCAGSFTNLAIAIREFP
jgi:inosine-uridine nucleoside N-ribohydrolase